VSLKTAGFQYGGGGRGGAKEECSGVSVRAPMRYPIPASVTFNWLARNGMQRQGKGRSRNISEGGAFVFTRKLPPVGASIILSIQFPKTTAGGQVLTMEMTGEVVRVELPLERKSNWGFAVACRRRSLNQFRNWRALSLSIQ
jgi:PilZ domain